MAVESSRNSSSCIRVKSFQLSLAGLIRTRFFAGPPVAGAVKKFQCYNQSCNVCFANVDRFSNGATCHGEPN